MKIFVTGGTGTIGSVLVTNLLNSDHEVTVITRDKSNVTNEWSTRVNLVEGDVTTLGEWVEELDKCDAVINLVGENVFSKRWTSKQKDRIYHSRVDSTQNLAEILSNSENGPKIIVSVSGADFYPNSRQKEFSEEDDPGDSFLSDVTKDWEKPIKGLEKSDIRTVIFRMGVAFTKSGEGAERMFLPHKFFMGGWVGSGKQIYSWIHVSDFAGLLQWAIENNHVEGVYNGASPEYRTMKELAELGGEILGRWTWTWVPGLVLKVVLGERANILIKGRPLDISKLIDAGYEFQYKDPKEALEDILK